METEKITAALEGAKAAGIDNIVALRGGKYRYAAGVQSRCMRTRARREV